MASEEAADAPVMTAEVVAALLAAAAPPVPLAGGGGGGGAPRLFVDGTLGLGGHAAALLAADPSVLLFGVDRDVAAVEAARAALARFGDRVRLAVGSYANLPALLAKARADGWAGPASSVPVAGVLLDLGTGSHHLDDARRGFSFRTDGPLDMRFASAPVGPAAPGAAPPAPGGTGDSSTTAAGEIVSRWSGVRLAALLRAYGELDAPTAEAVAKAITQWRGTGNRRRRILSTLELRMLVEEAVDELTSGPEAARRARLREGGLGGYKKTDKLGRWPSGKTRDKALARLAQAKPRHPTEVRRVFQALRIGANDSHAHLRQALSRLPALLAPGGRLAVLSFQPAEDLPVALLGEALTSGALAEAASELLPPPAAAAPYGGEPPRLFAVVTPEPLRPHKAEVAGNPRARSAHLRVFERLPAGGGSGGVPALADADTRDALATAIARTVDNRIAPLLPSLDDLDHQTRAATGSAKKSAAAASASPAPAAAASAARSVAADDLANQEPSFGAADRFRFTMLTAAPDSQTTRAPATPPMQSELGLSELAPAEADDSGFVVARVFESMAEPSAGGLPTVAPLPSLARAASAGGLRAMSTLTSIRRFSTTPAASSSSFSGSPTLALHPSVDDRVLAKDGSLALGRLVHNPRRTGVDVSEASYVGSRDGAQHGESRDRTFAAATAGLSRRGKNMRLQDSTLRAVGSLMGTNRPPKSAAMARGLVALRLRALHAQDAAASLGKAALPDYLGAALASWKSLCDPTTRVGYRGGRSSGTDGARYAFDAQGRFVALPPPQPVRGGAAVAVRRRRAPANAGSSSDPVPLSVALRMLREGVRDDVVEALAPEQVVGDMGVAGAPQSAGAAAGSVRGGPAAEALRVDLRSRRSLLVAMANAVYASRPGSRSGPFTRSFSVSSRVLALSLVPGVRAAPGMARSFSTTPAASSSSFSGSPTLALHPSVDDRVLAKDGSLALGRLVHNPRRTGVDVSEASYVGSRDGAQHGESRDRTFAAATAGLSRRGKNMRLQDSTLRAVGSLMGTNRPPKSAAMARGLVALRLRALHAQDAAASLGKAALPDYLGAALASWKSLCDPTTRVGYRGGRSSGTDGARYAFDAQGRFVALPPPQPVRGGAAVAVRRRRAPANAGSSSDPVPLSVALRMLREGVRDDVVEALAPEQVVGDMGVAGAPQSAGAAAGSVRGGPAAEALRVDLRSRRSLLVAMANAVYASRPGSRSGPFTRSFSTRSGAPAGASGVRGEARPGNGAHQRATSAGATAAAMLASLARGNVLTDPVSGAAMAMPPDAARDSAQRASRTATATPPRRAAFSARPPAPGDSAMPSAEMLAQGLSTRRGGFESMLGSLAASLSSQRQSVATELRRTKRALNALKAAGPGGEEAGEEEGADEPSSSFRGSVAQRRRAASAGDGPVDAPPARPLTPRQQRRAAKHDTGDDASFERLFAGDASLTEELGGSMPSEEELRALAELLPEDPQASVTPAQLAALKAAIKARASGAAAGARSGSGSSGSSSQAAPAGDSGVGGPALHPFGPTPADRESQRAREAAKAAAGEDYYKDSDDEDDSDEEEDEEEERLLAELQGGGGGSGGLRAAVGGRHGRRGLPRRLAAKGAAAFAAAGDVDDDDDGHDEPAPLTLTQLRRVCGGLGINLYQLTPAALCMGSDAATGAAATVRTGGRAQAAVWAHLLAEVDMAAEGPHLPTHDPASGRLLSDGERRAMVVAAATLAYLPVDDAVPWERLAGTGATLESLLAATRLGPALATASPGQLASAIRAAAVALAEKHTRA